MQIARAGSNGSRPDPLTRALYLPQEPTPQPKPRKARFVDEEIDYMPDGDVAKINADLEASQVITTLQSQIAELQSANATITQSAADAVERVQHLNAEVERLTDALSKAGPPLPVKTPAVKLLAPHGFIDEATGIPRFWHAGQVITDTVEIALLKARGAPVEDI